MRRGWCHQKHQIININIIIQDISITTVETIIYILYNQNQQQYQQLDGTITTLIFMILAHFLCALQPHGLLVYGEDLDLEWDDLIVSDMFIHSVSFPLCPSDVSLYSTYISPTQCYFPLHTASSNLARYRLWLPSLTDSPKASFANWQLS